ncbi:MAG TPA: type II toxin-antitoxin system HicB family antitoxin [Bryobacteraceae bacterium]|nr:type II toxin-antitoxin system HicB family antitoxin [Bryobacteraceae bacterium]
MQLTIRVLRETDGRWIADVPELAGVTVYGTSPQEATVKAQALALRVIAEEIEHGEVLPVIETSVAPVARATQGVKAGNDLRKAYEELRRQMAAEGIPFLNQAELEHEIADRKGTRS